jgi:hypothetical protein
MGTHANRNLETIPNHAFSCIIKTMGPQKQEKVPVTPIEVQLGRGRHRDCDSGEKNDNRLVLS